MPLDPQVASWRARRVADRVRRSTPRPWPRPGLPTWPTSRPAAARRSRWTRCWTASSRWTGDVAAADLPAVGGAGACRCWCTSSAAAGRWARSRPATAICRTLANLVGCAVVAVGYRLAPEHRFPAAVRRLLPTAVSWIAESAGDARRWIRPDRGRRGQRRWQPAAAVTVLARQRAVRRLAPSCWSTPTPGTAPDTESLRDNDDPAMFNRRSVDWYWSHYLDSTGRRRRPAGLAAAGSRPHRAAAGAGDHRRVRPVARRGRAVRRAAAGGRSAGRADPL